MEAPVEFYGKRATSVFLPEPRAIVAKDVKNKDGIWRTKTASEGTKTASEGTKTATERTKMASEGTKTASKGTKLATEGTKMASEGTKTASEGTKTASVYTLTLSTTALGPIGLGFQRLTAQSIKALKICKNL
jgi:hypothetical protein